MVRIHSKLSNPTTECDQDLCNVRARIQALRTIQMQIQKIQDRLIKVNLQNLVLNNIFKVASGIDIDCMKGQVRCLYHLISFYQQQKSMFLDTHVSLAPTHVCLLVHR